MNKNRFGVAFAISDLISTSLAWALFYLFRKLVIEPKKLGDFIGFSVNSTFFFGIVVIPLFWFTIFYLFGSYKRVYRISRLRDLANTLSINFFGSVFIFFMLLLDDVIFDVSNYRTMFLVLFMLNFILRYFPRYWMLTSIKKRIVKRQLGFNTLLIGNNETALKIYTELENEPDSQGFLFRGYLKEDSARPSIINPLICLGTIDNLSAVIRNKNIEEVIIALDETHHALSTHIVDELIGEEVVIKVVPDLFDILSGRVKMRNIFGTALVEIWPELISPIEKNIKRLIDISVSILVLTLFSPLYFLLAVWVKSSSKGRIFFYQERIGKKGKPFNIIKFRSMYENAEKGLPQLSSHHDPRITSAGKILRKYRLDELPQFFNVLIGEMSLVGPRPERQFYIDQIMQQAPQFRHLLKVQPGITSWGQVKYGYAENVEEMIQRLKYDLLYIENMGLGMDFKILAYTVLIIIKGKGK